MVYTFRLVSDEVDNFRREIQIDSEATFLKLRDAICESVGYDKNALSSFYICDEDWEREQEISLEDMDSDSSQDVYLMEETPLDEFVKDEGQRLVWVFDYMTERSFFIEMKKMLPYEHLQDPLCTIKVGNPPEQTVEFEDFDVKADSKSAAMSEFDEDYGSDTFTDEELDEAGYFETNFDE